MKTSIRVFTVWILLALVLGACAAPAIRERPLVDDQFDRWRVQGQQCPQLSHTNGQRLNLFHLFAFFFEYPRSIRLNRTRIVQ
jgi:hypothetical protein